MAEMKVFVINLDEQEKEYRLCVVYTSLQHRSIKTIHWFTAGQ